MRMYEKGVEGDLFNLHQRTAACEIAGCVPEHLVPSTPRGPAPVVSPYVHRQGLDGTTYATITADFAAFTEAIEGAKRAIAEYIRPAWDAIREALETQVWQDVLEEVQRNREAMGSDMNVIASPGRAMICPLTEDGQQDPNAEWQELSVRSFTLQPRQRQFPLGGMTLEPLSHDRVLGRWLDTDDDFGYSEDQYVHDDDPAPRTELCWKSAGRFNDACNKEADPESPSGLCTEHMIEMRGRWSDND